ncbi:K02A2.6-like [Cordylochernes scorpioides]|uniref:RNA-directed DNA polymerase n=1 Tax=Cordylochernes scorpioides TaxID=51811 RepID=A0ABY6KQF6_9ARAC|nr:K02A2.6-like [Cordylochernes scorpioides]
MLCCREEKTEVATELKEELEHTKDNLNKLRQENLELIQDARTAKAYRDEIDILNERRKASPKNTSFINKTDLKENSNMEYCPKDLIPRFNPEEGLKYSQWLKVFNQQIKLRNIKQEDALFMIPTLFKGNALEIYATICDEIDTLEDLHSRMMTFFPEFERGLHKKFWQLAKQETQSVRGYYFEKRTGFVLPNLWSTQLNKETEDGITDGGTTLLEEIAPTWPRGGDLSRRSMEMSTPANSTNLAILGLHPSAYKVRRTPVIKAKWDVDGARGSERMWGQQTHGSWSFEALKEALVSKPILQIYNPLLTTHIFCDASTAGLGGVLKQEYPDGTMKPIAFYSRALRGAESKYTITELELLAIIETCKRYHPYISGQRVIVHTDHKTLIWLNNFKHTNGRLFRWSLRLSEYDLEFKYNKGCENYEADMLSRLPYSCFLSIQDLKEGQESLTKPSSKLYFNKDNITYIRLKNKYRIVVPPSLQQELIIKAHESLGHPERANATIISKLRLHHQQNPRIPWHKLLQKALEEYRNTPHSITTIPPVYLLFGIDPFYTSDLTIAYPPIEEARKTANDNTKKLHLKLVKRYNESHKMPNLKIGDKFKGETLHRSSKSAINFILAVKSVTKIRLGTLRKKRISKSLVGSIIKEDLQLKTTPSKFVPKMLTIQQKENRVEVAKKMLKMVEENPNWKEKVITGDETWVYGYDPETKHQSMEWKGKDEPRTKKSRLCKSKKQSLIGHVRRVDRLESDLQRYKDRMNELEFYKTRVEADKCKFTDINENLCDQFVSGCYDEATLKRLLSEPFLTFDSAINIANSVEAAKSQVNLMKNPGHDIDKLKARSNNFKFPCKYNNPCKICGKSNHDAKLCKFKNAQCYICNKKGHIAPVCWNKKSAQNSGMNKPNLNKLNTIQCNTLENAPKILVNVKIEDADTIMEVDTEKIDKELDRLEQSQIIEKVNASDWSTPLVTVIKSNGELRLCGYFKNTLNNCIEDEKYPLPTIETMLGNLGGNKIFTKLDLSSAYHQIEMDEASKNLLVVSTHRGLYRYNRLPFGISPASAIFQRCMDSLFHDVPNMVIYLDDIFIGSKDEQEHYRILKMIFDKLKELNFTLNKEKCLFFKKDICFLGHIINEDGVRPDSKKLEALERCKKPFDKTSLKSFLGMLSFYSKYIPNMSTLAGPLYQLLKKDNRWKWSSQCEKAFLNLKLTLLISQALIHYSMKLPLTLTCDASAYGLSGVLCHIVEGEEKPITFVSRTLSSAEAKYSQTEKEALAIVFATSKLRQYLFGRKFVLKSDHKALTTVFGNKRLLPPLIANRLHRWALELSNFDFDIRYTNKDTMLCADAFSRLPLEEINSREDNIDLVTHDISFLNVTPLDHLIIEEETNKDPVLNKLKEYLLEDPQLAKKDETMKPFLSKLENFSILQGCIFVDSRAVIPRTCQDQMLKLLHQGHIGINRMKSLARSSVWWPKMDSQIEEFVKECSPCMHHQTAPPAENTPWPRTNQPWQRVHVDHFYFRGDCYLLVVDANSNWIEVFPVRGTTSQENIKLLRECFARNTPTSLDKPPVERLLSYVPRTFVNCLNSEFIQRTFGRNECGRRHFQVGDKVLFTRVIQNRRKWFKAQVIRRLGYNVYLLKNLKGTFKVHVNQMRTGSDTKYAEDSDWTLDNAGAGPHRLEQDPQISTSPPPRRSTRPRCPPCRFSPTMYNIRKEE